MDRRIIEERAIFIGLAGSHGYGLARPDSDLDYRGAFIAPKSYYLGTDRVEQVEGGWDTPGATIGGLLPKFGFLDNTKDTVLYELRKLIHLLTGANPNVLELLWLNEYEYLNPIGNTLIHNRHLFLTKKVKHSYLGYAVAQLKKIETHRKWLLNPPQNKPVPADFGVDDMVLSKEDLNAFLEYLYMLVRGRIEFLAPAEELYKLLTADIDFKGLLKQHPLPPACLPFTQQLTRSRTDFIKLLHETQAYRTALNQWEAYESWKKNRNIHRAGMEAKVGFDVKHAAHCMRLLTNGIEILNYGELKVNRHRAGDAPYFKSILNGSVAYEQLMTHVEADMVKLEIAYVNSSIPDRPDVKRINDLCIELVEMMGL